MNHAQQILALEDRIAELEYVLGLSMDTQFEAIRSLTALPRTTCQMIGILLARELVTKEAMHILLYGDRPECDQPEEKILDVHMCKVRTALDLHGVEVVTVWAKGWTMPRESKEKLLALLAVPRAIHRPRTRGKKINGAALHG